MTITTGLVDTYTIPRLMKLVSSGRLDPTIFATHRFALDDTMDAYDTFADAANTKTLRSCCGLFLSLGPQLAAGLFHSTDHLVAGISVFALAGSAAVAQLAFGRTPPWIGAAAGSVALAGGMVAIVIATAMESSGLFLAGAVVGGAGFGVAFLGSLLRALSAAIQPEHRGAVMSAFYVVAYYALSLPAILAGVLVTPVGLQPTFEIFGSVIAALALAVALQAWRTRPRTQPASGRRGYDLAA